VIDIEKLIPEHHLKKLRCQDVNLDSDVNRGVTQQSVLKKINFESGFK